MRCVVGVGGSVEQLLERSSLGAAVLDRVITVHPEEPTVTMVARALGRPKPTVWREAERLMRAGLLLDRWQGGRYRLLRINQASPLYPAVQALLFVTHGTELGGAATQGPPARSESWSLPKALREFVPDELCPGPGQPFADPLLVVEAGEDGPPVVEVRARMAALRALAERLERLPRMLELAYRRWSDPRDQALAHRIDSVGAGLDAACHVLREAAEAAGDRDQARVGARRWALAVCCLDGEAVGLRRVSRWCAEVVTLRGQLDHARRRVADLAEAGGSPALARRAAPDEAHGELSEVAERLTVLAGHDAGPDELGVSGERLVAVEFDETAERLEAQVATMAAETCFAPWRDELTGSLDPTQG